MCSETAQSREVIKNIVSFRRHGLLAVNGSANCECILFWYTIISRIVRKRVKNHTTLYSRVVSVHIPFLSFRAQKLSEQ